MHAAQHVLALPPLAAGETYLCGLILPTGAIQHTVIVGYNDERLDYGGQLAYARSLGGTLLSRVEGAVLWTTQRELASKASIWLEEECEWDSAYAWYQYFSNGRQSYSHKSAALRAVVVRRSVIQSFDHSNVAAGDEISAGERAA